MALYLLPPNAALRGFRRRARSNRDAPARGLELGCAVHGMPSAASAPSASAPWPSAPSAPVGHGGASGRGPEAIGRHCTCRPEARASAERSSSRGGATAPGSEERNEDLQTVSSPSTHLWTDALLTIDEIRQGFGLRMSDGWWHAGKFGGKLKELVLCKWKSEESTATRCR